MAWKDDCEWESISILSMPWTDDWHTCRNQSQRPTAATILRPEEEVAAGVQRVVVNDVQRECVGLKLDYGHGAPNQVDIVVGVLGEHDELVLPQTGDHMVMKGERGKHDVLAELFHSVEPVKLSDLAPSLASEYARRCTWRKLWTHISVLDAVPDLSDLGIPFCVSYKEVVSAAAIRLQEYAKGCRE